VRGRVTAGLIASVANSVLAKALAVFAERHPEVEVTAFESYSSMLLDWVRAGLIDFAFVNRTAEGGDLQATPILDEPFALIGAAGSSPPPPPVTLRDLRPLRLVLPTKRHGLRASIDRAAERERLVLPIRLEVDAMSAIEQLVARPGWFTILPATALQRGLRAGTLRAYPLLAPHLRRQVVCASSLRHPPGLAGRRFIEILQAELGAEADALAREVGAAPARRRSPSA
jgi:DNA-binding transcriptional LysR family regulator